MPSCPKKKWNKRDDSDPEWSKIGDSADARRQRGDAIERECRQRYRNWLITFLVIGVTIFLSIPFKNDTYVGFYYPNANDPTEDIQSDTTFESLSECRNWVDGQISIYNPDGENYDYECGKNCNLEGEKPYVCEETTR